MKWIRVWQRPVALTAVDNQNVSYLFVKNVVSNGVEHRLEDYVPPRNDGVLHDASVPRVPRLQQRSILKAFQSKSGFSLGFQHFRRESSGHSSYCDFLGATWASVRPLII